MYLVFYRANTKLGLVNHESSIEWHALGRMWNSEEEAVAYIKYYSSKQKQWHTQFKVMKVTDLEPVKVYEYATAQRGPIQVVESE
jgi:hypothetical protein